MAVSVSLLTDIIVCSGSSGISMRFMPFESIGLFEGLSQQIAFY